MLSRLTVRGNGDGGLRMPLVVVTVTERPPSPVSSNSMLAIAATPLERAIQSIHQSVENRPGRNPRARYSGGSKDSVFTGLSMTFRRVPRIGFDFGHNYLGKSHNAR